MLAQAPTTEPTSPDIPGRKPLTTDGVGYETGYAYNLSGAMVEQRYPSGRVVKNVLDMFNSRLQPVQIALGSTGTDEQAYDLLKLDYGYGGANNNGNVLSQTITVPSVTVGGTTHNGFTAVQNYTYDALNRLDDAAEYINGSQAASWRQDFSYDRYGNRNFVEANTTFEGFDKLCSNNTELCADLRKVLNPSANASDNRLSSSDGYVFDTSGNTVRDPQSRRFTYDGENKQVKVETLDLNGNPISTVGEYSYDGDGKRVKKHVPSTGEVTVFVYDAAGKLIGEYSTIVASSQDAKVSYLTNDHLGSPRINTDQNGVVTARHDYHPFGEEAFTPQRVQGLGYQPDDVRQKFTGYERDNETELDFAQARYFASGHGRFSSPDPVAGDQLNPQSLNRYPYVLNNPLLFTDPTGLEVSWEDSEKKKKKGETEAKTDAQRAYEKRLDDMINSSDKKTREKGERLKADYERLQKSDIVFHVVKENPSGTSSGELYYKGQEGHLYVSLKGDSSAAGSIPLIQKLGHEFKHGVQFLDGQLGFAKNSKGEWRGYRDDLVDEAEAWSAGFDARQADPGQRAGSERKFLDSMATAYPFGIKALVAAMDRSGPYKGRSKTQIPITNVTPSIYAIPRIK